VLTSLLDTSSIDAYDAYYQQQYHQQYQQYYYQQHHEQQQEASQPKARSHELQESNTVSPAL